MKTIFNNSLLIIFAIVLTACSKENDPVVVPEPTAQELILGTWNINRINSGIYISDDYNWEFEQGEAIITFRQDSIMLFQNNGTQTVIPLGESQKKYFFDKFCSTSDDISCPDEEKTDADVLVTFVTENDYNSFAYNSIVFSDNGNTLIFGLNYMDGADYHCTKLNDNL